MNLVLFIVLAALFVVLTPGILLRLPANGSKLKVAIVHGLVFALIWSLTRGFFVRATSMFDINIGGSLMEAVDEKDNSKKETPTVMDELKKTIGINGTPSAPVAPAKL